MSLCTRRRWLIAAALLPAAGVHARVAPPPEVAAELPGARAHGQGQLRFLGLRIYDIRDPYRPEEIAAFLPVTPKGQRGCRISDVFVDDRGIVYAMDRARGGMYVLEYTGQQPLD